MSGLSVWDEEPGLFSDRRLNMPRRPKMDVDMDITPMIDVTFLLLIFFLVASRVAQDTEVTLPAAKNGTAVTSKNAIILTVTAPDPETVEIYQGSEVDAEQKLAATSALAQNLEIRDFVQAEFEGQGKENVLIRADRSVKHREISRIMKAIGQVEGVSVYLAVYEQD
ncbi:MAG: biopolymer transporter ExbD [Planctomycetota bacterium]